MDSQRVKHVLDTLYRAQQRRSRVLVTVITGEDGEIDAGDGLVWAVVHKHDGQALARVRSSKAKAFPGATYKAVAHPETGVLELLDPDPVTTSGFFAGLPDPAAALSVPAHGWTHRGIVSLDPVLIELQQILGLQVRPVDGSLEVAVDGYAPFGWEEDTLDLTSVAAITGQQKLVIVCYDTIAGTLVALEGATAVSGTWPYTSGGPGPVPFTASDIADVEVPNHYRRLAALRLYGGQTELAWSDVFADLRDFIDARPGWLRLDEDDPTLDGLANKLIAGSGVTLSREAGDTLVISAAAGGWGVDTPPTSPGTLDDEFNDSSIDGKWTEYDPGAVQTPAEAGTTLTLTQATQTVAYATGLYQVLPSGDFTIALKVKVNQGATAVNSSRACAGIMVWEDATDSGEPLAVFGVGSYRTSTTTYSGFGKIIFGDYDSWGSVLFTGGYTSDTYYYVRLVRDGSTYYFDHSTDGVTWTRTDVTSDMGGLAATGHVGIGITNEDTGADWVGTFDFFRYRAEADSVSDPVYGTLGVGDYVRLSGDDMTGPLTVTVDTADDAALVLKTGDDATANPLLCVLDSGDTALTKIEADGSLRVGDATDNLTIAADGTLTLNGDATVWEDLRVPLTTAKPGATNPPGFAQFQDNGSGSTGVFSYAFDDSSEEEIFFSVQLPHSWREGSDIEPHVHWSPDNADSGNVVWGLEYTWASINGTFGNTTIITVTDAADGTAKKHQIASFGAISGSGQAHSSMLICRLFRKAADAADTYGSDAWAHEIDFHYEINSLGESSAP